MDDSRNGHQNQSDGVPAHHEAPAKGERRGGKRREKALIVSRPQVPSAGRNEQRQAHAPRSQPSFHRSDLEGGMRQRLERVVDDVCSCVCCEVVGAREHVLEPRQAGDEREGRRRRHEGRDATVEGRHEAGDLRPAE